MFLIKCLIFNSIIHDWISFKVNEDYLPDSGSGPVQPVLKVSEQILIKINFLNQFFLLL